MSADNVWAVKVTMSPQAQARRLAELYVCSASRVGEGHSSPLDGPARRRVRLAPLPLMLSEHLAHPAANAGTRFEIRPASSPRRSHADLFVGRPDAIGAMRWKRTSDAPRGPSALPRARRASLRVARATARARTRALPVPRDASRLPPGVPPGFAQQFRALPNDSAPGTGVRVSYIGLHVKRSDRRISRDGDRSFRGIVTTGFAASCPSISAS